MCGHFQDFPVAGEPYVGERTLKNLQGGVDAQHQVHNRNWRTVRRDDVVDRRSDVHRHPGVSAMSPLWSDKALAEAAWANAVARGLVDEDRAADREKESGVERVRRIARPRLHSWAL